MLEYLLAILCFCLPNLAYAGAPPVNHVFAFASRNQLPMGIGQYDSKKGWSGDEGVIQPPQPGDVFTLYTMAGEVAQVTDIDSHRPYPSQTPAEWKASISAWYRDGGDSYALAVSGVAPVAADPAKTWPLDQPEIVTEVSTYLKKRGLDVPAPHLTQIFEVTLSSGGSRSLLVTAHSDASSLRDNAAAAVYALALLLEDTGKGWKVTPFAQQTSYKPRAQSMEDHQQYYGTRDFYRFLACLDLDGDGRKEIVLYDAQEDGTEIDVFTHDGRVLRKVITAFKFLFN